MVHRKEGGEWAEQSRRSSNTRLLSVAVDGGQGPKQVLQVGGWVRGLRPLGKHHEAEIAALEAVLHIVLFGEDSVQLMLQLFSRDMGRL